MSSPKPVVDYYALLEIDRKADHAAIGNAVRSQRRRWVTRQNSPSLEKQREAEDRLVSIAAAEVALLDPTKRQAYDTQLETMARLAPAPAPVAVTKTPPAPQRSAAPPPVPPAPIPPAPVPPAPIPQRHDWLAEARTELSRGDLRGAKYAAHRATDVNERDDEAWSLLAQISKAGGSWENAYTEINKALKVRRVAPYYSQLGEINHMLGNPEEAVTAFRTAGSLDPAEPGYDLAAAHVWLGQLRPDLALPILESLHQNHPDREDVSRVLAHALSVGVDSYITVLHDGTVMFTSPVQIDRARMDLQRARSLGFDDPDVRHRIDAQLQEAERSAASVWVWPAGAGRWIGWVVLGWLSLAIPMGLVSSPEALGVFLGLLAFAGVIWLFYKLHRQPGWQRNRKRFGPAVRTWGI